MAPMVVIMRPHPQQFCVPGVSPFSQCSDGEAENPMPIKIIEIAVLLLWSPKAMAADISHFVRERFAD